MSYQFLIEFTGKSWDFSGVVFVRDMSQVDDISISNSAAVLFNPFVILGKSLL